MAIVIPSKHIYSKSFDPVIDNNIDRVEVNAITPSNVYDYDTIVYNADFTDLGSYLPDNYDLKADNKSVHQTPATQPEMYYYAEAISFVNIRPAYTTVSIKIPKNQNNKLINKIYDKENIKYSLVLDEKTTVPISVTVNISSDDGKPTNSNISYAGFNWNYNDRQTAQIAGIELKDYLSISNPVTVPEANATPVQGVTATASKTLSNQENISSIYATLNAQDDTWDLLNLKILTAVYVEKAEENKYIKSSYGYSLSKTRTLSGTAEIYAAKQLSITIYGDTINLDLQDKTKIIGDGNNVFSFDGNEIIQTTNEYLISKQIILKKETSSLPMQIPYFIIQNNVDVKVGDKIQYENQTFTVSYVSNNNVIILNSLTFGNDFSNGAIINATALLIDDIDENYNKIINEWKNGKQTAVITCPIADYYDENGDKIIFSQNKAYSYSNPIQLSVLNQESSNMFSATVNPNIEWQDWVKNPTIYYRSSSANIVGKTGNTLFFETSNIPTYMSLLGKTGTAYRERKQAPMAFREGDIVIPYTYSNNSDKPLSYNKDFTPKQFKVVGVGISKNQGGMQELTLQEV